MRTNSYGQPRNTLDLHGLHVSEVFIELKKYIYWAQDKIINKKLYEFNNIIFGIGTSTTSTGMKQKSIKNFFKKSVPVIPEVVELKHLCDRVRVLETSALTSKQSKSQEDDYHVLETALTSKQSKSQEDDYHVLETALTSKQSKSQEDDYHVLETDLTSKQSKSQEDDYHGIKALKRMSPKYSPSISDSDETGDLSENKSEKVNKRRKYICKYNKIWEQKYVWLMRLTGSHAKCRICLTDLTPNSNHLELFFSCLRSRGGFNNNPSAYQLRSAIRGVMIAKMGALCTDVPDIQKLSPFVDNIATYISGYITRKLISENKINKMKIPTFVRS
ncbi:unnamed protein product [Gordionus sp. m RMFG-2023]